ncbi:MAG: sigma-70 family RNA polymerase sigma factor [Bryobacteraceae bacterium]|jgi:RNA polymerase sigma-70 factor (ECF subfamily)
MIEATTAGDWIDGVPDGHPRFLTAYPFARRAAQVRAIQASQRHGLSLCDREDLEQDAVLAVWQKLALYDPGRASLRTFAERVVENRVKSALRLNLAKSIPLRPVGEIDQEPSRAPLTAAIDLRADVQRVLAAVSVRDRKLAVLLTEFSPVEAGRRLGISHATVYRTIGRLRAAFAEAGLSPWRRAHERDTELTADE